MPMTLTIKEVLQIARKKATSDLALSRATGVARSTLWRIATGKTKGAYDTEVLRKLTRYILEGE